LTAETDLSRSTDVATDPAIDWINQQVDADIVAIGEPRITAMFTGAETTETDLSRTTDIATDSTVGRVG
jgi:hypothetical protein